MSLLARTSNRKRPFNRHCQECCVSEKCVLFPGGDDMLSFASSIFSGTFNVAAAIRILNAKVNQNKLKKYLKKEF